MIRLATACAPLVVAGALLTLATLCILRPADFAPSTFLVTVQAQEATDFGPAAVVEVHACDTDRSGRWVAMLPVGHPAMLPPHQGLMVAHGDRRCGYDVLTAATLIPLPSISLAHSHRLRVLVLILGVLVCLHVVLHPARFIAQLATLTATLAGAGLGAAAAVLAGLPHTLPPSHNAIDTVLAGLPWWALLIGGAVTGAACGAAVIAGCHVLWRELIHSRPCRQRHAPIPHPATSEEAC